MYGQGISQVGELVDMAADIDVINKAGSWYSYGEERIGQGRENAKTFLEDNPEIRQDIERRVRAHYAIGEPVNVEEEDDLTLPVDVD